MSVNFVFKPRTFKHITRASFIISSIASWAILPFFERIKHERLTHNYNHPASVFFAATQH